MSAPVQGSWADFVARVGVPAALAFFVLAQLPPRIDRGITIAERVDATMVYLAARGCLAPPDDLPQLQR
jgi:hypothetical protein